MTYIELDFNIVKTNSRRPFCGCHCGLDSSALDLSIAGVVSHEKVAGLNPGLCMDVHYHCLCVFLKLVKKYKSLLPFPFVLVIRGWAILFTQSIAMI